jgi:Co/Zn/Cd efflux system component
VIFGFFISYTLIEFTTNPSYSASSLIWSVLGFGITLVIYMAIYSATKEDVDGTNTLYLHVLSPFLISYMIIPLFHGIWTQIYYGIYTGWSNPLFVPQLADVTQTQEEVDEVTVDIQS